MKKRGRPNIKGDTVSYRIKKNAIAVDKKIKHQVLIFCLWYYYDIKPTELAKRMNYKGYGSIYNIIKKMPYELIYNKTAIKYYKECIK